MISVLKKITQFYMRSERERNKVTNILLHRSSLRRHTPHIQISLKCPRPAYPVQDKKHAFSLNSTPVPGGILNFRYVNLVLLPMLVRPH